VPGYVPGVGREEEDLNIETLGNLGEFIGSIAVLITLVYIALQTRQTVTATKQQGNSDLLTRRHDLMRPLTNDRDFIDVFSRGCAREQMDSIDAQRFTSFGINLTAHVQDAYINYKAGLIDEDVWEAERALLLVFLSQPGFHDWWQHGRQYVTPEFSRLMEETPTPNMVLYDPETRSWSRPEGGHFGKDA
jgi:hypothetical protein